MTTTLITGASSGIGEAFARELARRGHDLLLVARSEEKLIALCNELGRIQNIRAQYVAMDLSEGGAPARLIEETEKRDLQIDFLINNAGFGSMGDFADLASPYLVGHSAGVADLACGAARRCGLESAELIRIRRSALVHDLVF